MADLYDVNIQDIGLISGIPITAAFIGITTASFLSDYMRNHTTLSQPLVSKIQWNYKFVIYLATFCMNVQWGVLFASS